MGFIKDLFKDNNDINEKSVVGFLSFGCMVIAIRRFDYRMDG